MESLAQTASLLDRKEVVLMAGSVLLATGGVIAFYLVPMLRRGNRIQVRSADSRRRSAANCIPTLERGNEKTYYLLLHF